MFCAVKYNIARAYHILFYGRHYGVLCIYISSQKGNEKLRSEFSMEKVKTFRVYNLLNVNGDRLQLRLGYVVDEGGKGNH